jgi:hypothetical protein
VRFFLHSSVAASLFSLFPPLPNIRDFSVFFPHFFRSAQHCAHTPLLLSFSVVFLELDNIEMEQTQEKSWADEVEEEKQVKEVEEKMKSLTPNEGFFFFFYFCLFFFFTVFACSLSVVPQP